VQVYPGGHAADSKTRSLQWAVLRELKYLTMRMVFAPNQATRHRSKWTRSEPSMSEWRETVTKHPTLSSFDDDQHSRELLPREPLVWR
jgi:hypothetical protein